MGKNLKNAIGLVLIVFIGGVALFYIQNDRTKQNVLPHTGPNSNLETRSPSIIQATIKVGEVSYQVSLHQGGSVYDAMVAARKQGNLNFQGRNFPGFGFFVDEINGVKQNGTKGEYWIYYINNQKAQVGVSSYIIKPNDVISWKYEKSSD